MREQNPNITKWGFVIQDALPEILSAQIVFNRDYIVVPWGNFGYEQYTDKRGQTRYRLKPTCKTPSWWGDYTKIKHKRTFVDDAGKANYTRANLHNMILSFAALFSLELAFMEHLVQMGDDDYAIFDSPLFSFAPRDNPSVEDIRNIAYKELVLQ